MSTHSDHHPKKRPMSLPPGAVPVPRSLSSDSKIRNIFSFWLEKDQEQVKSSSSTRSQGNTPSKKDPASPRTVSFRPAPPSKAIRFDNPKNVSLPSRGSSPTVFRASVSSAPSSAGPSSDASDSDASTASLPTTPVHTMLEPVSPRNYSINSSVGSPGTRRPVRRSSSGAKSQSIDSVNPDSAASTDAGGPSTAEALTTDDAPTIAHSPMSSPKPKRRGSSQRRGSSHIESDSSVVRKLLESESDATSNASVSAAPQDTMPSSTETTASIEVPSAPVIPPMPVSPSSSRHNSSPLRRTLSTERAHALAAAAAAGAAATSGTAVVKEPHPVKLRRGSQKIERRLSNPPASPALEVAPLSPPTSLQIVRVTPPPLTVSITPPPSPPVSRSPISAKSKSAPKLHAKFKSADFNHTSREVVRNPLPRSSSNGVAETTTPLANKQNGITEATDTDAGEEVKHSPSKSNRRQAATTAAVAHPIVATSSAANPEVAHEEKRKKKRKSAPKSLSSSRVTPEPRSLPTSPTLSHRSSSASSHENDTRRHRRHSQSTATEHGHPRRRHQHSKMDNNSTPSSTTTSPHVLRRRKSSSTKKNGTLKDPQHASGDALSTKTDSAVTVVSDSPRGAGAVESDSPRRAVSDSQISRGLIKRKSSRKKKDGAFITLTAPTPDGTPTKTADGAALASSEPTAPTAPAADTSESTSLLISPRRRLAQRVNSVNILGIEFEMSTESSDSVASEPIEGLDEARKKLKQRNSRRNRLMEDADSIPEEPAGLVGSPSNSTPVVTVIPPGALPPKRAKSERRLHSISGVESLTSQYASSKVLLITKSKEAPANIGSPGQGRRMKGNLSSDELRARRATLGISSDLTKAIENARADQQQQSPTASSTNTAVHQHQHQHSGVFRFDFFSRKSKRKSERSNNFLTEVGTSGTDTDAVGSGFNTEGDDAHHHHNRKSKTLKPVEPIPKSFPKRTKENLRSNSSSPAVSRSNTPTSPHTPIGTSSLPPTSLMFGRSLEMLSVHPPLTSSGSSANPIANHAAFIPAAVEAIFSNLSTKCSHGAFDPVAAFPSGLEVASFLQLIPAGSLTPDALKAEKSQQFLGKLLMSFLYLLPDPLCTSRYHNGFITLLDITDDTTEAAIYRNNLAHSLVWSMPLHHRALLMTLVELIAQLASTIEAQGLTDTLSGASGQTPMDIMCSALGPLIFRPRHPLMESQTAVAPSTPGGTTLESASSLSSSSTNSPTDSPMETPERVTGHSRTSSGTGLSVRRAASFGKKKSPLPPLSLPSSSPSSPSSGMVSAESSENLASSSTSGGWPDDQGFGNLLSPRTATVARMGVPREIQVVTPEQAEAMLRLIVDNRAAIMTLSSADCVYIIKGGTALIESATTDVIIEKLLDEYYQDLDFLSLFFTTFNYFMTHDAFAAKLVEKFESVADAAGGWRQRRRRRILFILRLWVQERKEEILCNSNVSAVVKNMLAGPTASALSATEEPIATEIQQTLALPANFKAPRVMVSLSRNKIIHEPLSTPVKPLEPGAIFANSVEVVAQQLALIDCDHYKAIKPRECYEKAFLNNNLAPSFTRMTAHFNTLSLWVQNEIVSSPSLKQRVSAVSFFSQLATRLVDMNSMNAALGVYMGVTAVSVARLWKTWEKVSRKDTKDLEKVGELFSLDKNSKNYRDYLARATLPAIPYLGLLTKDLFAIEEAATDQMPKHHTFNMEKFRDLNAIISDILVKYQRSVVPFPKNTTLYRQLSSELRPKLTEDEVYAVALEKEPRANK